MTKVKAVMPSLYTENTKHMSKAGLYSYNYAPLDDYIVANYRTKGRKQIARDLNELENRITYRTRVLVKNKVIVSKRNEVRLLNQQAKLKATLKAIESQLKVKL